MLKKEVKINIASGYQIVKKTKRISLESFNKRTLKIEHQRCTSALLEDDFVVLIRHFIKCPHCASEYPTIKKYLFGKDKEFSYKNINQQHHSWTTNQTSLFAPDKIIIFNDPCVGYKTYCCKKCGLTSEPSNNFNKVTIRKTRKKFEISCQINHLEEFFNIEWDSGWHELPEFPLYESITFNIRNGHTYMQLKNKDNSIIITRDITNNSKLWNSGMIYKLISNNKYIKSKLTNLFSPYFNGELPFIEYELEPQKWIVINRFIGFPTSFFDSIPFKNGSYAIHHSFKNVTSKLHRADKIPLIYSYFGLPNTKVIKRTMYNNPGLFFYNREISELAEILNDLNLLNKVLCEEKIYVFLSYLHYFSTIKDFLKDYFRLFGKQKLFNLIIKKPINLCEYAIYYSATNNKDKENFIRKFNIEKHKNSFHINQNIINMFGYSIPIFCTDNTIQSCVYDGFYFKRLRTFTEYYIAGEALKNCLSNWAEFDSCVFVVMQKNKYIAAIEIYKFEKGSDYYGIDQALGHNNISIEDDRDLLIALIKWGKENKVVADEYQNILDECRIC